MTLRAKRYIVKVLASIGHDNVLPFSFTKSADAEKAMESLSRACNLSLEDLYVEEVFSIPSTGLDDFLELMESIADDHDERARLESERELYLRKHPEEYWNSEKELFLKRPIPAWGRFDEGWWRHITPDMFNAHKDHYRELFKEYGVGMLRTLASRAPNLVDKHQKETKYSSIYEKALVEGRSININTVGGYNDIDIVELIHSWDEPREDNQGITGILMFDGEFYPCIYGGHADLIAKLRGKYSDEVLDSYNKAESEDLEHAVCFFSHKPDDDISVVNSQGVRFTEASIDWLTGHLRQMSETQRRRIERRLHKQLQE